MIPDLPKEMYRMDFFKQPKGLFKEVVEHRATSFYSHFREEGFVFEYTNVYSEAIKPPELTTKRRIGYVVLDADEKVKKKGNASNGKQRKALSIQKGIIDTAANDRMMQAYNLDFLTPAMGKRLRDDTEEILRAVIDHDLCPLPLRNLYEIYMERGGQQLGILPKLEALFVESGSQVFDNITQGAIHDYLMCDMKKYCAPVAHIPLAFAIIRDDLKEFFGDVEEEPVELAWELCGLRTNGIFSKTDSLGSNLHLSS